MNWGDITTQEHNTILEISSRVLKEFPVMKKMDLVMDISAAHLTTKLDLTKLLEFDNINFFHDVLGIQHHINRNNGELEDCFLPRCTLNEGD